MRTFNEHLNKKLEDKEFRKFFDEERILLELSLKISDDRRNSGLSQQ